VNREADRRSTDRPAPVRRRGRWEFLVRDPSGAKPYISRTFEERRAGERWQIDSYDAIAAGQPIPDAGPYRTQRAASLNGQAPSPRTPVLVGELAWEWWRLTYDDEPMSSPSRRVATRCHIKNYIEPWFDSRIDDIGQLTYELGRQFTHYLAGHDLEPATQDQRKTPARAEWLTVAAAADACGVHSSTIKRAISTGAVHARREVRNGVTIRGSVRIATAELLAAGFTLNGRRSDGRPRRGLSLDYSTEILNTLRAVSRLARSRGLLQHDPLEAVKVSKARPVVANRSPNRAKERAITWEETEAIARELNIHHQVALWAQRVLGLRISEAFGLRIDDILDFGDVGLVVIQRQGGGTFELRNEYGEIEKKPYSDILKTSASHRVLGVPQPLLELLRTYVKAFHADTSTGEIDPGRRLILGMRAHDEGGRDAYREAFMAAAARLHLDYKHLGFHVVPQTLRKSISVELHSYVEITEHARSRYLGHAFRAHHGGAQMTAASYTPDMIDLQPFITAASGIGDLISRHLGNLFVPPGAYANPASGTHDPDRDAHVRRVLAEAGWTRARNGVSVDEAAEVLGTTPSSLQRRINQGIIDADHVVGAAGERKAVIPDDAFRRLLAEREVERVRRSELGRDPADLRREAAERAARVPDDVMTISRLARQLGIGYTTVYQWRLSGRISVTKDPRYDVLVVDAADVERELADADRVAALHQRSMTVADAGRRIGCGHSMIYFWLRTGRLKRDPETDQNGVTFVTRDSVERVAAERHEEQQRQPEPPPPPSDLVSLPEAQRLAGQTRGGIQRLVATGELVRRDHRKRFHIERASLEAYLAKRDAT
jgi:integrase